MNIFLLVGSLILYSYFLFSFSYERGYKQAFQDIEYFSLMIKNSKKKDNE